MTEDYPYAQFREALGTVFGRLFLVLAAIVTGSVLAGLTATRSLHGIVEGTVGFPMWIAFSLFTSFGYFVLPFILFFAIAFARSEWRLRMVLICTALMWWNLHCAMRWGLYDSPAVKQQEAFVKSVESAINEAEAARQKKAERMAAKKN